jgi:cytochrome bd ubiquinol oxidase subunit I
MSNLIVGRVQMGNSLTFHIIFSVLSISMPLLLCIAEELGLWNKDPCSLLAQSRRVNLYLWCRLQHGDLV